MKPRMSTSKKSTPFPIEYILQIQEAVNEAFREKLPDAQFIVEGWFFPEEIVVRLGFNQKNKLGQSNFEVSSNFTPEENALDVVHLCIDAAGSIMLDYIESKEELDLPRAWTEFKFNENTLYTQYSTVNTVLEKAANELLGESNAALVDDELENNEDALEYSEFAENEDQEASEDSEAKDSTKKRTMH